eukprot:gene7194-7961_t
MGTFFWLFSRVSGSLSIVLLALALSSGLYLLSGLAEEFPSTTAKVLRYSLAVIALLQALLWLDGLPLMETTVEFLALGTYALMLRDFPYLQLFSWQALFAALGFVATNILWLRYFLQIRVGALSVLGFFVVQVWSLPCGLVASLTICEQCLPHSVSPAADEVGEGKRKSSFRVAYDWVAGYVDWPFVALRKRTG